MATKNPPKPAPAPEKAAPAKPAQKSASTAAVQPQTSTKLPPGADPAGQSSSASKISRPDKAQVAARAYERYLQRGGEHGNHEDDWYAAERELSSSGKPGGHN